MRSKKKQPSCSFFVPPIVARASFGLVISVSSQTREKSSGILICSVVARLLKGVLLEMQEKCFIMQPFMSVGLCALPHTPRLHGRPARDETGDLEEGMMCLLELHCCSIHHVVMS